MLTDTNIVKAYFKNKNLQELYTTQKSKKYKLDLHVVRKFIEVITSILAAKDIYDLWNEPSLKYEKLKGDKNRYSFRIDRKYRLEVEVDWENEEKTIGIIGIDEISNHYG